MGRAYLFDLMWHIFLGFIASAAYVAVTGVALWLQEPALLARYLSAFANSFNCVISGGLIIGTASFVHTTQRDIPKAIEQTFSEADLVSTRYKKEKRRYQSLARSLTFSANFAITGFVIYYFCRFPLSGTAEYFLIAFGCVEYALGVYVGRKLFYIAHMLDSVSRLNTSRAVIRDGSFSSIINYVNILSTLTVIFVYIHVKGYYDGPFVFGTVLGTSPKLVLLLPAIIAIPVVVLFNFYPRAVLRGLYSRAIESDISQLTHKLRDDHLSEYERRSYLIDYERISQEELRYRLQLTLSDLPMGVTLVVALIGLVAKT